jgi:hypothetical protein
VGRLKQDGAYFERQAAHAREVLALCDRHVTPDEAVAAGEWLRRHEPEARSPRQQELNLAA